MRGADDPDTRPIGDEPGPDVGNDSSTVATKARITIVFWIRSRNGRLNR